MGKGVRDRRDDLQCMFDILILRSEQGMSVNQLLAALQSVQSGVVEKPSSAECWLKSNQTIHHDLTSLHKRFIDLKHQIRVGIPPEERIGNKGVSQASLGKKKKSSSKSPK